MAGGGDSAARGQLGSLWEKLNSSFWFVPALLAVAGLLLSTITQPLDHIFQNVIDRLPPVISGGAQGASSLLTAIAGRLITVIATVFSLTIVTLTLASAQYSPRLLRSFVADRGLQVVLGFYIGTFVYSLLVLRLISISGGQNTSFTPALSVAVAILLALVCVALLIYFINHVAQLIQSGNIVRRAHDDTLGMVSKLDDFEDATARISDPEENPRWADLLAGDPSVVRATSRGYVQSLSVDSVLNAVADGQTALVEIPPGPGNFVAAGLPLARVWPAVDGDLASDAGKRVNRAFVLGDERNFRQDLAFGLRQLSDIALKGLSPGINDPTTAMQAMDRMEDVFIALGSKALPRRVQEREIGGRKVLLKIGYSSFDDLAGLAFDQVRRAAFSTGQVAVLERLLEVLDRALRANASDERQRALWTRVFAVARLAPSQIPDPEDAINLVLRAVKTVYGLSMKERVAVNGDLEKLVRLCEDLEDSERVRRAVEAARAGQPMRARGARRSTPASREASANNRVCKSLFCKVHAALARRPSMSRIIATSIKVSQVCTFRS